MTAAGASCRQLRYYGRMQVLHGFSSFDFEPCFGQLIRSLIRLLDGFYQSENSRKPWCDLIRDLGQDSVLGSMSQFGSWVFGLCRVDVWFDDEVNGSVLNTDTLTTKLLS